MDEGVPDIAFYDKYVPEPFQLFRMVFDEPSEVKFEGFDCGDEGIMKGLAFRGWQIVANKQSSSLSYYRVHAGFDFASNKFTLPKSKFFFQSKIHKRGDGERCEIFYCS